MKKAKRKNKKKGGMWKLVPVAQRHPWSHAEQRKSTGSN